MPDTGLRNVGDFERLASGLGGAVLLGFGLARPSPLRTLFAAGGALLLERGITGHCSLYRALGVTSHDEAAPRRALTHYGKRGDTSIIDEIERASDHSFPASDPPSWTPHRAGSPAPAEGKD